MKSIWLIPLAALLVACGDSGAYESRSYVITHVDEVPAEPVTAPESPE